MKKLISCIIISAAVLSAGTINAFASQPAGNNTTCMGRGYGLSFVDNDNDGVCDNFSSGRGMGRGFGKGMGRGINFVDNDGDGICGNASSCRNGICQYRAPQISEILNKNTNTVYTLISRAKEMLKKEIGGDYIG